MDAATLPSTQLKHAMREYGEKSATLEIQQADFRRFYLQGLTALGVALLLAAAGVLSLVTLLLALFATWRMFKCFSLDEICESLEIQVDDARLELDGLMENANGNDQLQLAYEDLKGESFQGQLAIFLPGPIEVGRRPTR